MDLIRIAWERFSNNLLASFELMTLQKWIRVVIVVGTYMLLRPYLIALGKKSQMRSHEAAENEGRAEISPNELRGRVIPGDSDDEEEVEATSADWGKKARRRQRKFLKDMVDAEEKRLQESKEEEEDKDIEEFLVKE
ncbi:DUF1531-domain-containing protein [Thozetella sp. PMI_491]|nr:DUF1531-domain-containing protein [Thozetella sp. PMI_491]